MRLRCAPQKSIRLSATRCATRVRISVRDARRYPLVLLYSLQVVGFHLFSGVTPLLGVGGQSASVLYRALFLALVGWAMVGWKDSRVRINAGPSVMCMLLLLWMLVARLSWDWLFQSGKLQVDFV